MLASLPACTSRRPHVWRTTVIFVLLALLAAGLALVGTLDAAQAAAGPSPSQQVEAAWQQARSAAGYRFASDIQVHTVPLALNSNVGRAAALDQMHLEGSVRAPAGASAAAADAPDLQMTLWNQTGSVFDPASGISIKVEGDRAYARQGDEPWQEVASPTEMIAPSGDFFAFLHAARNIQASPQPPVRVSGIEYRAFMFDIDGAAYATYLRDQMTQQLVDQGQLPPGMELSLSDSYRAMTGSGELWLDSRGNPVRMTLHVTLPPGKSDQTIFDATSDFSDFALPAQAAPSSPWASVAGVASAVAWPETAGVLLAVVACAALVHFRSSRRLQAGLTIAVILATVVAPLLQSASAASFIEAQQSRAAAIGGAERSDLAETLAQMEREEQARLATVRAVSAEISGAETSADVAQLGEKEHPSTPFHSAQDANARGAAQDASTPFHAAQDASQPATPAAAPMMDPQLAALLAGDDPAPTDDGTDSDSDRLTDYQEDRLGSNPQDRDSDGDGVSDYDEVVGFDLNGKHYYGDPLQPDVNRDALPDGAEWNLPGTGHATWDTDGDGTPDLWSDDNDGDGVPDRLDLSPFSAPTNAFAEGQPLELAVKSIQPGKITYVQLQVRPTNPAQLQYAYNVLDWPKDNAAQVQDVDGKTFYDLDNALPASPNANGDLKLVPMLELRIAGAPSNLPLVSTPPATTQKLQDFGASGISGSIELGQEAGVTYLQYRDLTGANLSHGIYSGSCTAIGALTTGVALDAAGRASLPDTPITGITDGSHVLVVRSAGETERYACAALPRLPMEGDRWVDTTLLGHYGIAVIPATDEAKTVLVPLDVVTYEKTGERVAFQGKMLYRPTAAAWGGSQQVRLVWLLQGLVDRCRDGVPYGCAALNDPQMLHQYYSDFRLSGSSVREEQGYETALVYEDPAVDDDIERDDALILMAGGLDKTFLVRYDCDTMVDDRCQGDGTPDYGISQIARIFDHNTNGAVPAADRFDLPNILSVAAFSYDHADAAMMDMGQVQNPAVLSNVFGPYAAQNLHPSLLSLSLSRYRSVNLDAGSGAPEVSWAGNALTLDLLQHPVVETASMSVTPYQFIDGGWRRAPMARYWDELTERHKDDFQDEVAAGEIDEHVATGKVVFGNLYYLGLAQGVSSITAIGGVPQVSSADFTAKPALVQVGEFYGMYYKYIGKQMVGLAARGINPELTFRYIAQVVHEVPGIKQGVDMITARKITGGKMAGVLGMALLATAAVSSFIVSKVADYYPDNYGLQVAGKAGDTVLTALNIGMDLMPAYKVITMAGGSLVNYLKGVTDIFKGITSFTELSATTAYAALIGFVIDLGVAWGTFFFQWASGAIQTGTLAFNQSIAYALGGTIVAALVLVLSITIAGAILVGIVKAIDAFMGWLCNTVGVKGACFSISDYLTQTFARMFYDVTPTINMASSRFGDVVGLSVLPVRPELGWVEGNQVKVRATLSTELQQDALGDTEALAKVIRYAKDLLSTDALRQASVTYAINQPPPAAVAGAQADKWQIIWSRELIADGWSAVSGGNTTWKFDIHRGQADYTTNEAVIALKAGINVPVTAKLQSAWSLPTARCSGKGDLSTCKVGVQPGSDGGHDLGIKLDVFPTGLDTFYGLKWAAFGQQRDWDGDGLIAAAFSGLDPDDTRPDTDGDGVADGKEFELRRAGYAMEAADPATGQDTDGDGLTDRQEVILETDPGRPDTDADGLTDKQETDGWQWVYSADGALATRVTSDPTSVDTDGDGLSDAAERNLYLTDPVNFPYHPRRTDPNPLIITSQMLDAPHGFVAPGRVFTYTTTIRNDTPAAHPLSYAGSVTAEVVDPPYWNAELVLPRHTTGFYADLQQGREYTYTTQIQISPNLLHGTYHLQSTAQAAMYEPQTKPEIQAQLGANSSYVLDFHAIPPDDLAFAAPAGWDQAYLAASMYQDSSYNKFVITQHEPGLTTKLDMAGQFANTRPALACGASGGCLATVVHSQDAYTSTVKSWYVMGFYLRFNSVGQALDFTINEAGQCKSISQLAAASDGADYLAAWNCDGKIVARKITGLKSGSPTLGSLIDLSGLPAGAPANDAAPALAWVGDGYLAAWQRGATGARDIYSARLNPSGQVTLRAALAASAIDEQAVQLAYEPNSRNALAVFLTSRGIESVLVKPGLSGLTRSTLASSGAAGETATGFDAPQVSYDARNRAFQVAALATLSNGQHEARLLSVAADGSLIGQPGRVNYGALSVSGHDLGLACSDVDCALLAHAQRGNANGENRNYLQRFLFGPYYGSNTVTNASELLPFHIDWDAPAVDDFTSILDRQPAGGFGLVSGAARDTDANGSLASGVDYAEWQMDDGPWQRCEGRETFTCSVQWPGDPSVLHYLHLRAVDRAGNISPVRSSASIAVLAGPPDIVETDAGRTISAAKDADGRFTLHLNGVVDDHSVRWGPEWVDVLVSPHGTGWQTAEVHYPGWSLDYPLAAFDEQGEALADPTGEYTVTLRTHNEVGQITPPESYVIYQIKADNQPPQMALVTPKPGRVERSDTTLTLVAEAQAAITQTVQITGTVADTTSSLYETGLRLRSIDTAAAPGLWEASYYAGPEPDGAPVTRQFAAALDFDWAEAAPAPGLPENGWSASWQRDVQLRSTGAYTFTFDKAANATARLLVDGSLRLEALAGETNRAVRLDLTRGGHSVQVQYRDGSGADSLRLTIALAETKWESVQRAKTGADIYSTTWRYALGADLEGEYALDLRASDWLDNETPDTAPYWRGEIDTLAPRVTLERTFTGVGAGAQTTYRVHAVDYNLSLDGWQSPCPIGFADKHYYSSPWWDEQGEPEPRLYEITSECTVPGNSTAPTNVQACDAYGRCSGAGGQSVRPDDKMLYVAEGDGRLVQRHLATGDERTLGGDAGGAVTVDDAGSLYYATGSGDLVRLHPVTGVTQTVASLAAPVTDLAFGDGRLYFTAPTGVGSVASDGSGFTAATGPATGGSPATGGLDFARNQHMLVAGGSAGAAGLLDVRFTASAAQGTITGLDPTHDNSWSGDRVALDTHRSQLYVAGLCGDPEGGLPGVERDALNGVHRLAWPTVEGLNATGVAGCEPVILAPAGNTITQVRVDDDAALLYYVLHDGAANTDAIWRAALDGSAPVQVYAGSEPILGFAVERHNRPLVYNPRSFDLGASRGITTWVDVSDPDHDPITFTTLTPPAHGSFAWISATGGFTYTPDTRYSGADSVTFRAEDGRGSVITGTVDFRVASTFINSTVITPTNGSLVRLGQPITITLALDADRELDHLDIRASAGPDPDRIDFAPGLTETIQSLVWTPVVRTPTTLSFVTYDRQGGRDDTPATLNLQVVHDSPAITVTSTVITATQATFGSTATWFNLSGQATASTSSREVTLSLADPEGYASVPWRAWVEGDAWHAEARVNGPAPDGDIYVLTATVQDALWQTTEITAALRVDVLPPAATAFTVTTAGGAPLAAGQIVTDTHDLALDWAAAHDGSGVAGYYAGFSGAEHPDPADLDWYTTPQSVAFPAAEAHVYYAHLGLLDTLGNVRWQIVGPIYVDGPQTPDLVALPDYTGWLESPGALLGVDHALHDRSPQYGLQRLYASWDATNLALVYDAEGLDLLNSADLYFYLDTVVAGGARELYDPTGMTHIALPAAGGRALAADYMVRVTGMLATLHRWDGATWQSLGNVNTSALPGFRKTSSSSSVALTVPFSALDIADPAQTPLDLVALAVRRNTSLRIMGALPDKNPLNDYHAISSWANASKLNQFALTGQYHWDNLGPGQTPNGGSTPGANVRVWLTSEPASLNAGYLDTNLYNLLTPGVALDANGDGKPDTALPFAMPNPVQSGQTVTYTVHYENRGEAAAAGVNLRLAYTNLTGGPATLSLGDIAAGASGSTSFTVRPGLAKGAEVAAVVSDDSHGGDGHVGYDWLWALQTVDTTPPSNVTIHAPGYIRSGPLTLIGSAYDAGGVAAVEVRVTAPDGSETVLSCPQAAPWNGTWTCPWTAGPQQGAYDLFVRARDTGGLWSAWTTEPVQAVVDDRAIGLQVYDYEGQLFPGPTIPFTGTANGGVDSVRVCLDLPGGPSCSSGLVASAAFTQTWALDFPLHFTADNQLFSYRASGSRDDGATTAEVTGTLRLDNKAPASQVSCGPASVQLEDYLEGAEGLNPAPLATGTVLDGSGVVSATASIDGGAPITLTLDAGSGAWQFAPRFSEAGHYMMRFGFTDAAGNTTSGQWCEVAVQPAQARLALSMAHGGPDTLVNSGPVTYTFTISNTSAVTATDASLWISSGNGSLNNGLVNARFTPADAGCAASGSAYLCELGSLAPYATRTLTVTGDVSVIYSNYGEPWPITGSLDWDDYVWSSAIEARSTLNIAHVTDMAIGLSGPTALARTTTAVTYTITVTNTGPAYQEPALGETAQVSYDPPSGFPVESIGGPGWTCDTASSIWRCTHAALDAGATVPLFLTVDATRVNAGSYTQEARVSTNDPWGYSDPNTANNAAQVTTNVDDKADLVLEVSAPAEVAPMAEVTYTFTVTNRGPSDALDVQLLDDPVDSHHYQMRFAPDSPCGEATTGFICTLDRVPPGATRTFTATLGVETPQFVTQWITNTATLSSPSPDPVPGDTAVTTTTRVKPLADLALTLAGPETVIHDSQVITYLLSLRNYGPEPATSVVLTDTLPGTFTTSHVEAAGWDCTQPAGAVVCTRPTLLPGSTALVTVTGVLNCHNGACLNLATVSSATFDHKAMNNDASTAALRTYVADLALANEAASELVGIGDGLTYTLTVANTGAAPAHGVALTDTVPSNLGLIEATGANWACTLLGQQVRCDYAGPIVPGAAPVVTVRTQLLSGSGTITNTATVSTTDAELTLDNNTALAVREVNLPADLTVAVAGPPDSLYVDTDVVYTTTLTNHGPEVGTGLVVTATWGAGAVLAAAPEGDWSCRGAGPLVCAYGGELASGTAVTLPVTLDLTAAGPLTFSVEATSRWSDPQPDDNMAAVDRTVEPAADLSLMKWVNTATQREGELEANIYSRGIVTYTVQVANGRAAAADVVLTDTMPAGVTFRSFTDTSAWTVCSLTDETVTCELDNLPGEEVRYLEFTAFAPAAQGVFTNTATVTARDHELTPEDNTDSAPARVVRMADFVVEQVASPEAVHLGETFTDYIVVGNTGPDAATALTVTLTLPDGVTSEPVTEAGWTCAWSEPALLCSGPALDAGSNIQLPVTLHAPSVEGRIVLWAAAESDQVDPTPENAENALPVVVRSVADLALALAAEPATVDPGQPITYTVTITNQGPSPASGVIVTDTLPAGAALVAATPSEPGATCTSSGDLVRCAINRPLTVLLVAETGEAWSYGEALDRLGIPYTHFDASERTPTAADLAGHGLMLWVTGDDHGPSAQAEAAMADYLTAGGRLLLVSGSYGDASAARNDALTHLLGLAAGGEMPNGSKLSGQGLFAGVGDMELRPVYSARQITPAAGGNVALTMLDDATGQVVPVALYNESSVFLAFEFGHLYYSDEEGALRLLDAALDLLTQPMAAGQSVSVTLAVTAPQAPGPFTNEAEVTAFTTDDHAADNRASLTSTSATAVGAVSLTGDTAGMTELPYTFTAQVMPSSVALPLTYTWEATDQPVQSREGGLSNAIDLLWDTPGTKFITVTVSNAFGSASAVHQIAIETPNAVALAAFTAQSTSEGVAIHWTTASELNTVGFNVYRAMTPRGPWARINPPVIDASGSPLTGAGYTLVDEPGSGVFYYVLEDIALDGIKTQHGVIRVAVPERHRSGPLPLERR